MKTICSTILILLFAAQTLFAQNVHFATSGSIEYEKSVNMFALIKRLYGKHMEAFEQGAFDSYKKSQPQFKVMKSTLTFNGDKTLYTPIAADAPPSTGWFNLSMTDENSTVYTDLDANTVTSQKNIFDQTFLVKDSLQKIKWKITDETREIAGYQCRRANGILLDSVYVVAFYTDKIAVSGGPESFCGLPGMILEVALPHENLSWMATKVNDMSTASSGIVAPKKGKPINYKQLYDTLLTTLKNNGDPEQINFVIKQYMF